MDTLVRGPTVTRLCASLHEGHIKPCVARSRQIPRSDRANPTPRPADRARRQPGFSGGRTRQNRGGGARREPCAGLALPMRAKLEARDRDRVVMPSRSARARASRPGTPPASNCAAPASALFHRSGEERRRRRRGVCESVFPTRRSRLDFGIFLLRVASRVLFFFSSRSIN